MKLVFLLNLFPIILFWFTDGNSLLDIDKSKSTEKTNTSLISKWKASFVSRKKVTERRSDSNQTENLLRTIKDNLERIRRDLDKKTTQTSFLNTTLLPDNESTFMTTGKSDNDTLKEELHLTQLDPLQQVPTEFFIPFSLNYVDSENKTKEYKELQKVGKGHFVGYGIASGNGSLGNLTNYNISNKTFLSEECQIQDIPMKVCGSDGYTYDNLSQFYCAQKQNKELKILWDGPCNRTEWPKVKWDPYQSRMKVINPEEIVKYFS